jgi:hypothetical protein
LRSLPYIEKSPSYWGVSLILRSLPHIEESPSY